MLAGAAGTAVLASAAAVALLLPPREPVENPEYYANGSRDTGGAARGAGRDPVGPDASARTSTTSC